MAIHFTCPSPKCGRFMQVADELAGKTVVCPTCRRSVPVPAKQGQESDSDKAVLDTYQEFLRTLADDSPPTEQQAPPMPPPRPAAGGPGQPPEGFDDLSGLATAREVARPLPRPLSTPAPCTHIAPLSGSFFRQCLRAIRHPGADAGSVLLAAISLAGLETYRRQLLPYAKSLPAGWRCKELCLAGAVILLLVLGGYCLSVCLSLASAAVAGGVTAKTGVRRGLIQVIGTGLMGIGLAVIYVMPVITLPLLPMALLTLSTTGHGRAFDLRGQLRAAFRYGDGFAILWLVLVVGVAAVTGMWEAMLVISGPLAGYLESISPGVEGKAIAGVALFFLAMVAAIPAFLLACGLFRCVGLLGRYRPAVLESMPTTCPRSVTYLVVTVCLLVLVLVLYALP